MNKNRSYRLGALKALRRFGSRKGLAPYNATQWARHQIALAKSLRAPVKVVPTAFNRFAAAAKNASIDFHEFAKFIQHGPLQSELALQDCIVVAPLGDSPWFQCPGKAKVGNVGVSVHELETLAQQYKYLHPK